MLNRFASSDDRRTWANNTQVISPSHFCGEVFVIYRRFMDWRAGPGAIGMQVAFRVQFANSVGESRTRWTRPCPGSHPGGGIMSQIITTQGDFLLTLEEVSRQVSTSGDPSETLDNIVQLILARCQT